MKEMKEILVTGAAGTVGTYLRQTMKGRYRLRLSDQVPIGSLDKGEEFMPADITDFDAVMRIVKGVGGIIHLGGISKEDAWDPILQTNIIGTYNVYEAARRSGVKRFIFASSNHVVGFYSRRDRIGVDHMVRPDSRYGVSKAFGEALGSLYAYKYGLEVLCIRIGNVAEAPVDRRRLAIWISPRDLTKLIEIGLERAGIKFEIVFGMSDNQRAWWEQTALAKKLGYQPNDRSEDYAQEILSRSPPLGESPADQMQGGEFVVVEDC